jgi:hypothetical protein
MIEITGIAPQRLSVDGAVLFSETALKSGCGAERHREGSAQVTLAKPGIYEVAFNGDIAVPTTGTAGSISIALALDGEPIPGAVMTSTPGGTGDYNNVSTEHLVRVCAPCCAVISVVNTSDQAILVKNANLTVTRVSGV